MIRGTTVTKLIFSIIGTTLLLLPVRTGLDYSVANTIVSPSHQLSVYDYLFQRLAYDAGMDWQLLSAIAFMESRYDPMLRSRSGAIGLMQIMPLTARHFNVPVELLEDPTLNISLSIALLRELEDNFDFSRSSDEDRIKIILAGYNCGMSNLTRARREAAMVGADYNRWEELKMFGKLNNSETRKFVANVMRKWTEYKLYTLSCSPELPDSVSAY